MIIALLVVVASLLPLCAPAQDVSDCFPVEENERRIRLDVGAGTASGFNAGESWHIPVTADRSDHVAMEMTMGFDPFKATIVPTAGLTWTSIARERSLGGSLSLSVNMKEWEDNGAQISRGMIGLMPGLLIGWGSRIVSLRVGPALAATTTFTRTADGEETIKQNELMAVAELKVTLKSPF
jgi:hypothetical protein